MKLIMLLKEAKRAYFTDEINDSAGDNKKMWSTLKKLLPNMDGGYDRPFIF